MSLLKLAEIRSNKPGLNMIHYMAMVNWFDSKHECLQLFIFCSKQKSEVWRTLAKTCPISKKHQSECDPCVLPVLHRSVLYDHLQDIN